MLCCRSRSVGLGGRKKMTGNTCCLHDLVSTKASRLKCKKAFELHATLPWRDVEDIRETQKDDTHSFPQTEPWFKGFSASGWTNMSKQR